MRITVLRNLFRPCARLALATVLAVILICAVAALSLGELMDPVQAPVPMDAGR